MKTKLNCPVCDRAVGAAPNRLAEKENTCPNCETDLSLFQMLVELPTATQTKPQKPATITWLTVTGAILLLVVGISFGAFGNYWLSEQKHSIAQTSTSTQSSFQKPEDTKTCGGFYYTVRRGDSLSLVASRFYGDGNLWQLIAQVNPEIKGRESALEIDEKVLIPNRQENCL